jgi:hypothetical protein
MYKTRCWVVSFTGRTCQFSSYSFYGERARLEKVCDNSKQEEAHVSCVRRLAAGAWRSRCNAVAAMNIVAGGAKLADARGVKHILGIASQTRPFSSRRSTAAPLNVCVPSQTRPGRGGIFAEVSRGFSLILTAAENRKRRNLNASLRLRTAWRDRIGVRQRNGLRGSDGAALCTRRDAGLIETCSCRDHGRAGSLGKNEPS